MWIARKKWNYFINKLYDVEQALREEKSKIADYSFSLRRLNEDYSERRFLASKGLKGLTNEQKIKQLEWRVRSLEHHLQEEDENDS